MTDGLKSQYQRWKKYNFKENRTTISKKIKINIKEDRNQYQRWKNSNFKYDRRTISELIKGMHLR